MKKLLIFAALIALAGSASAQEAAKLVKADDVVWKDHPFSRGLQIAVLVGNPRKAEVVVQRVKFPPNFQLAPHTHPYAEVLTVISGSVGVGMGEQFNPAKGELVKAGSVHAVPAKTSHYLWTEKEGVILQIQFVGPGGINYVNPADDPRKK